MLQKYRDFAEKYFSFVFDKYPGLQKPVESCILKSGLGATPKNYLSSVLLSILIVYFISLSVILTLSFTLLKFDILIKILLIVFAPFAVGAAICIICIFYPYERVLARRRSISTNLPFALAHMGAIASSGIPPTAIFKLLAEFSEYDALADEMKKIVRNIEVFGLDPVSAVREVAERTPSDTFKQLLLGMTSTIQSGGDLKIYLKNAGEQALFTWRINRQKYLEHLSTYAEFYTGLLIASPLFLISLFSIMYMIQPELGGFDIFQLMKLSCYLIIPALNIAFMFFLEVTQMEI